MVAARNLPERKSIIMGQMRRVEGGFGFTVYTPLDKVDAVIARCEELGFTAEWTGSESVKVFAAGWLVTSMRLKLFSALEDMQGRVVPVFDYDTLHEIKPVEKATADLAAENADQKTSTDIAPSNHSMANLQNSSIEGLGVHDGTSDAISATIPILLFLPAPKPITPRKKLPPTPEVIYLPAVKAVAARTLKVGDVIYEDKLEWRITKIQTMRDTRKLVLTSKRVKARGNNLDFADLVFYSGEFVPKIA